VGHLANIFLALIAVAFADEVGPYGAVPLAVMPLCFLLPYLFLLPLKRAARRGDQAGWQRVSRIVRRTPIAAQLIADLLFGWGALLVTTRGVSDLPPGWPTPWELLRFLPFVLATVTSLDVGARSHDDGAHGRRWFRFQLRAFLGAGLPFVIVILVDSLLVLHPQLPWSIQVVSVYGALHTLALLLGLATLVPWLLRHAWAAEPLPPGPMRDLIEAVAARAKFRCNEVLLWRTGRSVANAMIVGVLPSTRRIFFSDSLLESLPARELAAVTAHEIGHAKRGHMALFLLLALGGFGSIDALAHSWDASWPVPLELAVLGLLVPGFLAFRSLSRRFELEADLHAFEVTGDSRAIGDALLRLGGRLRDVAGWRHFAPSARDAFIQRAAHDLRFLRAFRRRMTLARVAIVAFFLLGFGGSFATKWSAYGIERLYLAQWTGEFASAEQRSASLDLTGDERRVLRYLATEFGDRDGESRDARVDELRTRALAEARAGRATEHSQMLLLGASWMGDELAAELLTIHASFESEEPQEGWEHLPPEWRAVFERHADDVR